jgi:hypothetical protein
MESERYSLFFGYLKLGVVKQTDSDFPNLWGAVAYDSSLDHPQTPEAARLARFVALNKESIRLLDMEDEQDTSTERAVVDAELAKEYSDYVDSNEWRLVDDRGQERPILCPILRADDQIVWRWNPERS